MLEAVERTTEALVVEPYGEHERDDLNMKPDFPVRELSFDEATVSLKLPGEEVGQENPWHRDYIPKFCGLGLPEDLDRVYTFLYHSSLNELRLMGCETLSKRSDVKNIVICYLIQKAVPAVARGQLEWDGFFRGRYQAFCSSSVKISTPVRVALSKETIVSFAADSK